jgi:hypothetical protein
VQACATETPQRYTVHLWYASRVAKPRTMAIWFYQLSAAKLVVWASSEYCGFTGCGSAGAYWYSVRIFAVVTSCCELRPPCYLALLAAPRGALPMATKSPGAWGAASLDPGPLPASRFPFARSRSRSRSRSQVQVPCATSHQISNTKYQIMPSRAQSTCSSSLSSGSWVVRWPLLAVVGR